MGQHRTREQKEHATVRREQGIGMLYALPKLSSKSEQSASQSVSRSPQAKNVNEFSELQKKYFKLDMLKTLLLSLFFVVVLVVLKWRLGS